MTDRTHLDFRFWCYSFHNTLALLNLRPGSTGISPYRHWHGHDFDILKYPIIPFGSIMAAHFLWLNNTHFLVAVLLRLFSVSPLIIHIPSAFGTRSRKKLLLVGQWNFWAWILSPQLLLNITMTAFNNPPAMLIRCCYHRIPTLWILLSILLLNSGVLQNHLHPRSLINSGVLLACRMNRRVLMLNPLTLLLIDLSRADIIEVVRRNTFLMWVALSMTLLITSPSAL